MRNRVRLYNNTNDYQFHSFLSVFMVLEKKPDSFEVAADPPSENLEHSDINSH